MSLLSAILWGREMLKKALSPVAALILGCLIASCSSTKQRSAMDDAIIQIVDGLAFKLTPYEPIRLDYTPCVDMAGQEYSLQRTVTSKLLKRLTENRPLISKKRQFRIDGYSRTEQREWVARDIELRRNSVTPQSPNALLICLMEKNSGSLYDSWHISIEVTLWEDGGTFVEEASWPAL